jgi:phosphoglycolate phosphatase
VFRLLVFDWDGTLMDSERRIVGCVRAAIEAVGAPQRSDEAIRDIIGLGLREAVFTLFPDADESFLRRLVDAYRDCYLARGGEASPLFPGVREVIEDLHGRGYFLAVATGKSRRGLERGFRETGLGRWFHASRCADEAASKPHPRMLLELMDELGVAARHTLMIGDTVYDLEMAQRARASGLGVTYGVHAPERLRAFAPLALLEDLRHLPQWLETVEAGEMVWNREAGS